MSTDLFFRERLLAWSADNSRDLPWVREQSPYKIWLSEIILQQTRVEQGLPYYQRFVERFPTVQALAEAPEDAVLKLWEGLGYYSRARNLHATARQVAGASGGRFPATLEGLRALKGVGDYTAAAIASFAYGLPHAVVDGNVYRVLSRFFGIDTPVDTPEGKRVFTALADRLLDPAAPGVYNQAIMDFGATQCTPRAPGCAACPLSASCAALAEGRVDALPVKSKQLRKKDRFFLYAVVRAGESVLIRQRTGTDIWRRLYEFPMLELPEAPADLHRYPGVWLSRFFGAAAPADLCVADVSRAYRQTLTHQQISAVFIEMNAPKSAENALLEAVFDPKCHFVPQFNLKKIYALPRIIDWYWAEKGVPLGL